MTLAPRFRIHTRATARDTTERGRVSSPLELLFDLTFVAAIAQIAAQLAKGIVEGDASSKIVPFMMVFFAIWWAWMNFTWFASSYDTDDVPYRILTMVQMVGVLVLAAGVPAAFNDNDFTAIVVGYFIMRVGLVAQWVRVAVEVKESRATALRYAVAITVIQVLWLIRLALPVESTVVTFVILAILELSAPIWAERSGDTFWHPHHIAERYGLFTIILLGESVLASTTGLQRALEINGLSGSLITISISGVVLLFALWWLYYLEPAGDGLEARRTRSFLWGYGHYFVFGSLAALGGGLEVAVEAAGHHLEVSNVTVGYAVAIPVGVFLICLWAVHAPLVLQLVISPAVILPAAVVILLLPLAAPTLTLAGVISGITLVCVLVIAATIVGKLRRARQVESASV